MRNIDIRRRSFVFINVWGMIKIILIIFFSLVLIHTFNLEKEMLYYDGERIQYDWVTDYEHLSPDQFVSGVINNVVDGKSWYFLAETTEPGRYIMVHVYNDNPSAHLLDEQLWYYHYGGNHYRIEYNGKTVKMNAEAQQYANFWENKFHGTVENVMIEYDNGYQRANNELIFATFGFSAILILLIFLASRKFIVDIIKWFMYRRGLIPDQIKIKPRDQYEADTMFEDQFDDERYFFDDHINEKPYVPSMPADAPKYEADEFYTQGPDDDGYFYVGTEKNQNTADGGEEQGENQSPDDDNKGGPDYYHDENKLRYRY